MNSDTLKKCSKIVGDSYVDQALETRRSKETKFRVLIEQQRIPDIGWEDSEIEMFIAEIAAMDSNNFQGNCGAGEREARFASDLVKYRHFRLGHGIGRSGDLTAIQPKAAGSSILMKLSNALTLNCLRMAGVPRTKTCFIVPMATGMTLTLCLLALRKKRPNAKYVLWPRIDQKSCFKSMDTAGFEAVVVENKLEGDELRTDIDGLRSQIHQLGAANIVAIMSTTSCFAPRVPDRLEDIGRLCKEYSIPHLVNNAYGVQSSKCMAAIQQASGADGRVDAYVQSADKNFMVPVGGAVVAGFDKDFIESISKLYPGRASATPALDILITLLGLGASGWRELLEQRKLIYSSLRSKLAEVAERYGERVLDTPHNNISMGVTVDVCGMNPDECTKLGSMLFKRLVSGTRVIPQGARNTIAGHDFTGWGSHTNSYQNAYLTAAAVVGATEDDVQLFINRLDKVFAERQKQRAKAASSTQPSPNVKAVSSTQSSHIVKAASSTQPSHIVKAASSTQPSPKVASSSPKAPVAASRKYDTPPLNVILKRP